MKKRYQAISAANYEKASQILNIACDLMALYSQATGAHVSIHDHNYITIAEMDGEMPCSGNACQLCVMHEKESTLKNYLGFAVNPCKETHVNAIKESYRFGGSYIYACKLGFMFWTSPIYINEQFAGALTGGGFLGIDHSETLQRMRHAYGEQANMGELKKLLENFPLAEPPRIKSLAELMLLCAKSLSTGSEGYHTAMRRRAEQQADLSGKIEDLKNSFPYESVRYEYPFEKEQLLLEALARADSENAQNILNEILAAVFFANPDQFKAIQYRAMELAILICRADTSLRLSAATALQTHSQYIGLIQESSTIEELTDAMYQILDDVVTQVFTFQGIQHSSALKKAERYILENFTRKISLEEIATVSGFSPPYFSTIFKEEMGENLSSYLNRLRVEKASFMLTDSSLTLSKIAYACGFEDQSWFSKIFKEYTGINPGKYRAQEGKLSARIPDIRFEISR
ncbi:MAG: helix-turn-helix domain-containing protein [Treponema sp.]|jgi:AraC-like DNA-binding protein/ligand-binding sensor protein|nr:helix-turn-helix domain-containing protein [Treponema sp.]